MSTPRKLRQCMRISIGTPEAPAHQIEPLLSPFIAPEFIDGSPVLGDDLLPVLWFWDSAISADGSTGPISETAYIDIDGERYKVISGVQYSLQIIENTYLDAVTVSTVINVECADGIKIAASGINKFAVGSYLTIGSNSSIFGYSNNPEIINLGIRIKATAKRSSVRGFRESCDFDRSRWHSGITLLSDSASVPEDCTISDIVGVNLFCTFQVNSGKRCIIKNIESYSCNRPHLVFAAEACLFENIKSYSDYQGGVVSLPIVGFLNIAERVISHNRGIINCTYRDISIDGWSEEGFSFDGRGNEVEKRALVFNGHIALVWQDNIQLVTEPDQDCIGLDVVFNTGKLAGSRFEISSISGKVIKLLGFSTHYIDVAPGDFIGIEVPCYGNTVANCSVKTYQDPTGICVWLWGGNTTYINTKLDGCIVFIICAAHNMTAGGWPDSRIYQAPHNVKFLNTSYSMDLLGTIPADKKYGFLVDQNQAYNPSLQSDATIPPEQMRTVGIDVRMGLPDKMKLKYIRNMRVDEIRNADDIPVIDIDTFHPATLNLRT